MVLNNEGLNRVRDLIFDDTYKTQAGSGVTVPNTADTGLASPIANTLNTPLISKSDQQLTFTNIISTAQGSGVDLSEGNVELGDATTQFNLLRFTFNPLTKAGTEEHLHITRYFLRNNL